MTEPAVGDDVLVRRRAARFQQRAQFVDRLERRVFGDQILEVQVLCAGDVTQAFGAMVRRPRRAIQLAAILLR